MRQLTRIGIALGLIGMAALPAVAQTDAVSPATPKLAASAVALPSAAEVKANGNNATFAYTVNGVSQSKSITRQVFRTPGTVCH